MPCWLESCVTVNRLAQRLHVVLHEHAHARAHARTCCPKCLRVCQPFSGCLLLLHQPHALGWDRSHAMHAAPTTSGTGKGSAAPPHSAAVTGLHSTAVRRTTCSWPVARLVCHHFAVLLLVEEQCIRDRLPCALSAYQSVECSWCHFVACIAAVATCICGGDMRLWQRRVRHLSTATCIRGSRVHSRRLVCLPTHTLWACVSCEDTHAAFSKVRAYLLRLPHLSLAVTSQSARGADSGHVRLL